MQLRKGMTPAEVDALVDECLQEMTLQEKVSVMTGSLSLLVSGYDMFIRKHYNHIPYCTHPVKRYGIPAVRFSDGPRGVVMGHSTCFPVSMARGASFDPELEERIGEAIGREIRAQGGNFYGGVCINLLRHPGWGRAQETYGEDPYLLGEMGAALVRGVQKHNVMACIKHYAGNSVEDVRMKVNVKLSPRALREIYLPHFKRCIDEGAAAVMGAYNQVNGDYCCESHQLLTEILRDEFGFQGFTISDFVNGIYDTGKAVRAGMDIEMPSPIKYGSRLVGMAQRGEISLAEIDRSVRRILRTVVTFATADDPQSYPREVVGCEEHRRLAQESAEKSMVLLKNEQVLPWDKSQVHKLVVIGRLGASANIGDYGSSRVHPPETVSPLQGLGAALVAERVIYFDGSDLAAARKAAAAADAVVIVAGYDHMDEGEKIGYGTRYGGDRRSLRLKPDESALIQAVAPMNPRTVVVLAGGSAIVMEEWRESAPAILMAFYAGMRGGNALSRILFGEVNPSGRLPFTIACEESDYPFFDPDALEIEYGYYHGYTLLEKQGVEPAFPFGFGLSYTRFVFCDASVDVSGDLAAVSVTVENAGSRAGETVVQLYLRRSSTAVDLPVKTLRGFAKIHLNPGEQRRVALHIPRSALAVYNEDRKVWVQEESAYAACIGASSRDADLLEVPFRF